MSAEVKSCSRLAGIEHDAHYWQAATAGLPGITVHITRPYLCPGTTRPAHHHPAASTEESTK